MGNYATTTSLFARMQSVQSDTATSAMFTEMIGDAEAEVNKYLSKRYDVSSAYFQTTTSIPPIVRKIATRLAEGYAWAALSRGSKESLARSKQLIDMEMQNLQDIADYKVDLLDSLGAVIPDSVNTPYRILSNTKDYSNTFNEDEPTSWKPSAVKLDDIEAERDE